MTVVLHIVDLMMEHSIQQLSPGRRVMRQARHEMCHVRSNADGPSKLVRVLRFHTVGGLYQYELWNLVILDGAIFRFED